MSGVTGRTASAAFAKFATNSWGVAASVTRGIVFESTGGLKLQPIRVNDEAFGQAFYGRGDLGNVTAPALTFVARSRYDDHSFVWDSLFMGSPGTATLSSSVAGQTTSYTHVLDLAASSDGLGLTLAFDKVHFVDELTSLKVHGLMEKVGAGGVMDKSYKITGSKPTNISSINTRSTVNGASFVSLGNRVFMKQGVFRLNVQGASALASTDAKKVEDIELEFERPQDAPFVFGQDYVHEPADNGFPTFKLKIKYARMEANESRSLYAALINNPIFKADLIFTGTNINSADAYLRKYQFPALELDETNGFDISGATQVKPEATFMAKLATSSPAGMAFVNPFRLTVTNTFDTAAF